MTEELGSVIAADSVETITRIAAEWLARAAVQSVEERGVFTLALSGGSTPEPLFCLLTTPAWRARIPWAQTHVYWCDERAVPPDDPQSNFAMANRLLLDAVGAPPAQVCRMEGEDPDLEAAAARYATILPDPLDLLLLGIGEDGHTASLFPGSPLLHETRRVAVEYASPKPPPRRLTLTPPVIASARALLMLAMGKGKADAVARALDDAGTIMECPARLARRGAWLLDRAAARLMLDGDENLLTV